MRRDNASRSAISSTPTWAWWASLWLLVFGVISLYWATGGTIGISTLAQTIQDQARDGDGALQLLTAITGVLKNRRWPGGVGDDSAAGRTHPA